MLQFVAFSFCGCIFQMSSYFFLWLHISFGSGVAIGFLVCESIDVEGLEDGQGELIFKNWEQCNKFKLKKKKLVSTLSLRYGVWSIVEMLSLRHDTLIIHTWFYNSPEWVKTDLYNDPFYVEYTLGALSSSKNKDVSYWNCSQRILSKAYVHEQSCPTVGDPRDCNHQAPLSM